MNKKFFVFVFGLIVCGVACGQPSLKGKKKAEIVQDEWNNIEIFEQHKQYPRVNVIPYANENDIEKNRYINSPYYVSLNGNWKMDLKSSIQSHPTNMEQKSFSTTGWETVSVPAASWQSGRGEVQAYPLTSASEIPGNKNYIATYYREFNVDKTWKDYQVFLNLQAKSAFYVWVNQEYVGYSEDSRDLSEFDITKHLRIGKANNIIVQVFSNSDGSLLETLYSHSYNGIDGDVFLVLKNKVNISDFRLTTSCDDSGLGELSASVDVFNTMRKGRYYVEMEIWDTKGKQVEKMGRWVVFDKKNELTIKLDRSIPNVSEWTAETPNMYTAVFRLRDEKMSVVETVGTRFGFRTVGVKDGLLCVNGKPITLCGATYVYYDFSNTKLPTREQVKADLCLMKQNNINAVRTSFYSPAPEFFYELCDELGLYVVCDANIQPFSTQSKAVATDKAYIDLFVARVQNMYEHLKNHPSIIVWSLGSGVDNGICMENAYRTLKQKDKTRVVLFSGAGYSENTDVVAPVNLDYDDMKLFAAKSQSRPMVLYGFGSTVGNSYGSLEPLWQLVRQHPSLQGGFATYWNPFVYYNSDHQREITTSGLVTQDRQTSPYLAELRNIYRPFVVKMVNLSPDAAEFNVSNHLAFLTLNDYTLEYTIFSNLKSRIIEGDVSVNLKPGESKNFKLKVPKLTLYAGEELFIRFVIKQRIPTQAVPKGTELGVVEFPLPMKGVQKESIADYDKEELFVNVVDDQRADNHSGIVQVYNDNIELWYNLDKAEIVSYKFRDHDFLTSSPLINFWRAATDNDRVDKNAMKLWHNLAPANLVRTVVATHFRQIDKYTVGIDAMLRYTDPAGAVYFDVQQSMAILHTGDVLIDNEIVASEMVKTLPKVGLQMCLPKDFQTARWFGLDKETYSDRRSAGVAGTYKRPIHQLFFKYDKPQESGNRTSVRWVSIEDSTMGLFVDMMDTTFNFSIYPYSDIQLFDAPNSPSLKEQDFWTFNVDYRQSGVGTSLAGTDIAEPFLVNDKKYKFRVHLRAYDLKEYNPYDFCRVEYPQIASSVLPMPTIAKDRERFDRPMTISLSSATPKSEIRYTLDGSTPTEHSMLYKKPFVINGSTYVKAKAYKKGSTASFTAIKRFNFDYIIKATFANKPNTPYNYDQETILFDGETADIAELSHGWLGFSGNDLDVVFELSKPIELQDVVMSFAHVPDAWAFAPSAVKVYVSEDGENYSPAINARIKYASAEESMNSPQLQVVTVDVNRADVRFVRVVAKNLGRIPSWHKAKGLRPWIMVDEIQLNEVIK